MGKRETVHLGLSGLGSFSVVIANTIRRSQKVKLVTCFDVVPERRNAISERYGCAQEKSFEDMVKRDDLDGVLLVTPNALHREQTELAAQHGKHVYVEKPIANTLEDGRKMIEACEKAGGVLLVGHVHRRHAANRKVKELIESGAIGNRFRATSIVVAPSRSSTREIWSPGCEVIKSVVFDARQSIRVQGVSKSSWSKNVNEPLNKERSGHDS